jgi:hypothetical protein
MRPLPLLAIAVLLAGCGSSSPGEPAAPPAPAATPSAVSVLGVQAAVTPARAGTPERPQGVTLDLALELGSPGDVEPPLATRADVVLPEGTRFDGGAVPACRRATLARKGPRGCPGGSVVGEGTAVADADTSRSEGTIAVVNGGADAVFLFTTLTNPVRVQAVVPGTIRDGRLRLTFPEELQVVAGVPLALRELRIRAGRDGWLATTACPAGGWRIDAAVEFDDGTRAERAETVPCER